MPQATQQDRADGAKAGCKRLWCIGGLPGVLLQGAGCGATPAHTSGKPLLVMFLVLFHVSVLSHHKKHVFAMNPSPLIQSECLIWRMFLRVAGCVTTLFTPSG
eukprot:1525239-Amphidinium_carterae.1